MAAKKNFFLASRVMKILCIILVRYCVSSWCTTMCGFIALFTPFLYRIIYHYITVLCIIIVHLTLVRLIYLFGNRDSTVVNLLAPELFFLF